MAECVGIRLAVRCTECETSVPVNGPVESVKCARCSHVIHLKGKLRWPEILNFHNPSITVFQFAARAKDGAEETGAWAPISLTAVPRYPRCACGFKFTEAATRAAVDRELVCTKCSKTLTVSRVPPFFSAAFPFATHVIAPPARAAKVASAVPCSSCGAGLPLDGSRIVICTYCKTSNAVAAGAGLVAATKEMWWVLFDASLLAK